MTIDCEISRLSIAFQSTSSLFQSVCSCSPKSAVSVSAFCSVVTISSRSPSYNCVSEVGIETLPSRHSREMTKGMWLIRATSRTVMPNMPGLCTWKAAM